MRRMFLALALMCVAYTTNAQSLLFGDITNNCVVDVSDVTKLIDIVLKGEHIPLTRTMKMEVGNKVKIGFTSGSDTYSISSSTSSVAEASIIGPEICIIGKSLGSSTITVADSQNNNLVKIEVTVSNTPVAVDLGLPSGLKWSNMNVGANSPEDYGDYFAWGEVTPQSDNAYSWESYKWCNGSTLTKYCTDSDYGNDGFTDNKTVLDAEDDAAHANWGGDWRMPTEAECQELIDNTTSEWTTQNGVYGYRFTSTSNGNSIFLPAAGSRWNGELIYYAGSYGLYWSSTLNESGPNLARYLDFRCGGVGTANEYRCSGQSVRPVRKN